jgi:hypothetical protein
MIHDSPVLSPLKESGNHIRGSSMLRLQGISTSEVSWFEPQRYDSWLWAGVVSVAEDTTIPAD